MAVAMKKMQEFQSEHNAISLDNQAKAIINTAAEMQRALFELEMTKNTLLNQGFSRSHPKIRDVEERIRQHNQLLVILRDGQSDDSDDKLVGQFRLAQNLFLPLREIPKVALGYADIEKEVLVKKALMQMLLQQEAEALIEARPDRILWGSNWPHPIFPGAMPNDGDLLDQFLQWAGDEATAKTILVDNPARLYGFEV